MKRKTLILLVVTIIFSFSSISAKSDITFHNNAAAVLSEMKNSKDYNSVKKYLTDENDEYKIAAIYVLAGLDKVSASADLKNIYAGSSYEAKRNIIYALGEMRLNDNIVFLSECLNPSEKIDINNEAIIALVKTDDKEVIRPLINYLNQFPENKILVKQMPLLGVKLIEPLFLNLQEKDEKNYITAKIITEEIINANTKEALMEIVKLSASVIEPVNLLAKEMINERKEDAVISAVELFKTAGGRLEEEITNFLCNYPDSCVVADNLNSVWKESKDENKKIVIIDILCSQKSDDLKVFLLDNITDPSEKVRNHLTTKMEPRDYYATEILNRLIKADDINIRGYYKDALVNLGGGNFLFLLRLFAVKDFSYDAEDIMIRLKDKNVDKTLLDALIKEEKGLDPFRERIRAIIVKRTPLSIETLVDGLKDKNSKDESKKMLLQIGKQTVPALINVLKEDQDDLQTATATEILIEFGENNLPELIKELSVEDLWSKMNIAYVLVKLKHKEVIPSLIEVLGSEDSALRYRAIYALRDLGTVSVPELIKNLDNSKEITLIGIIRSLGEIRDKSAISSLKSKLASIQNEKIKVEIEKALKMIGE
ncbi:MAG: hypothetical protein PHX78_00810 [bacterium]|nr:hypothetical protein [bacterium]